MQETITGSRRISPKTCSGRGFGQGDGTMNPRENGGVRASAPAAAGTVHPAFPIPCPGYRAREHLPADVPAHAPRANGHHENGLLRDSLHVLERDGVWYVISEDYSYKSEPYYTILSHELSGKNVRPASSTVLDAYVVPICLERARLAGIPVAEWGVSQGYVPLPSIIYGLNYFATSADFFEVRDGKEAKEVIAHVTNKGKYPFCFQKISADATVRSCTSIFGRTTDSCPAVAGLAEKIYRVFSIPLVTLVFVRTKKACLLSSLAPARYSRMSGDERALLTAYISRREFP
jgi:hypothetical protein